jgi:hypothetical protein
MLNLLFVFLHHLAILAVFKPVGFVQVEPSYSSVAAVGPVPPAVVFHQKLKLLFVFLHLLKVFLLYLNLSWKLMSKKFHYILLLLL